MLNIAKIVTSRPIPYFPFASVTFFTSLTSTGHNASHPFQ